MRASHIHVTPTWITQSKRNLTIILDYVARLIKMLSEFSETNLLAFVFKMQGNPTCQGMYGFAQTIRIPPPPGHAFSWRAAEFPAVKCCADRGNSEFPSFRNPHAHRWYEIPPSRSSSVWGRSHLRLYMQASDITLLGYRRTTLWLLWLASFAGEIQQKTGFQTARLSSISFFGQTR